MKRFKNDIACKKPMQPQLTPEYLRREFPDLFQQLGEDLVNSTLVEFVRMLGIDPRYFDMFMRTLKINKFEARNQDENSPRIFDKTLDNLSVVTSYRARLPWQIELTEEFTDYEKGAITWYLLHDPIHVIGHFGLSAIEGCVMQSFPVLDMPYVLKGVDEYGFVTTIKPHSSIADKFALMVDNGIERFIEADIERHLSQDSL